MLNGWKSIAAYLQRDERTAMRWAAERGLPVHRTPGAGRGTVYALSEEIEAWLAVDRGRAAATAAVAIVEPAEPPIVTFAKARRWSRPSRIMWPLAIAGMLLAVLGATTLLTSKHQDIGVPPTIGDPITRALFLQASYDWNRRTRDSLARATREYGGVIARDPRVPDAYVGLANSYLLAREFGTTPDADAYARAEAAARAAAALDPRSAAAHRALGFIAFWWRRDLDAARDEFAQAIALKPDDSLTHHWLATALMANGEREAALREIDVARGLDPTATALLADRGIILYVAGRRAEGLNSLRALSREQPDAVGPHRSLAEIALFEGHRDEFLREAAMVARLRGDAVDAAEVARWRASGPSLTTMEEAMLRDARLLGGGWFRVARLAALTGRRSEADDALSRACRSREPATVSAAGDLWLSRALSRANIAEHCGVKSLM